MGELKERRCSECGRTIPQKARCGVKAGLLQDHETGKLFVAGRCALRDPNHAGDHASRLVGGRRFWWGTGDTCGMWHQHPGPLELDHDFADTATGGEGEG